MDKLGHAFSSYTMTNLFAEHLQRKGRTPAQAALSAVLLTQALMLYVETFDGFSTDHGFAYEDVIMNLAGTSLAYARQRYPKLKDLVDYRMEYSPSGYKGDGIKGFRPVSDYAGQKYLLALKLSGIRALKETPLKYVELLCPRLHNSRASFRDAKNANSFCRSWIKLISASLRRPGSKRILGENYGARFF